MVLPIKKEDKKPQPKPPPASSSGGGKLYSEAAKPFGSDRKDTREVFEAKLFSPDKVVRLKDVLSEISTQSKKSSLCGLHYQGKDLIASFLAKEERDRLCQKEKLKVSGIEISISLFPPKKVNLNDHFRYSLSHVPMSATSLAIEKALHPLAPSKYIIEKLEGSKTVRTGRVIFWSPKKIDSDHVFIGGKKCPIKCLEKEKAPAKEGPALAVPAKAVPAKAAPAAAPSSSFQFEFKLPDLSAPKDNNPSTPRRRTRPKTEEKEEHLFDIPVMEGIFSSPEEAEDERMDSSPTTPAPKKDQDPLDKGSKTMKRDSSALSPASPSLTTDDKNNLKGEARKMEVSVFETLGLQRPRTHSVLSIYENLTKESDSVEISKQVKSDLGKDAKRERVLMSRGNGKWDLFVLSTSVDKKGEELLTRIYSDYALECTNEAFVKKLWIQKIGNGESQTLVIFKSRILLERTNKKKS